MEAFSGYGKVIDTYIAYNNPGRQEKRYTFVFVRFSNCEEATKAVKLGNNRRIDGFTIKVFLGNNQDKTYKSEEATAANKSFTSKANKKEFDKFTNRRSYKEVLLKKNISEDTGPAFTAPIEKHSEIHDRPKPVVDPYHFSIPAKELEWMDNCLVGQIKVMHDASFVEQALISDGFKVKVSVWLGYYAILQFKEQEQIEIFWDLKKSLLESWFDDIDCLEHFSSLKKLKVWVTLENVPIVAWNNTMFNSIASRWRSVIKIDDDTFQKNRFDNARILMGIKCLSDVPSSICIFINGNNYHIRISVSSYEDERCWIDADQMKSHNEVQLEEESDEEASCHQEDFVPKVKEKTAGINHKKVENLDNCHISLDDHLLDNTRVKEANLPSDGLRIDTSLGSNKLVEIPIVNGFESTKVSPESSGPFISELDKETGLFSIKPKYLKIQSSWGPDFSRLEMDKSQVRLSPTLVLGKSLQGKIKVNVRKSKHISKSRNDGRDYKSREDEGDLLSYEARNALEIFNSVGLYFAISNEIVSSRLEQIERENAMQV
ncbi:hypothetical protein V6N13_020043 [Hibiscus sabdariffa]|uniref:RRM domain-containing protein n=1 Tax=Hibiscus sabdariffa TaxID=183260 RepID=A0ABR2ESD9_9ROSI